mmetsp:Transcript_7500/g.28359  ORF Transcript_7500/g.28359 Transcript_7500/m.28359 type:complete len:202 (-) Transcript_7500:11-616(-)
MVSFLDSMCSLEMPMSEMYFLSSTPTRSATRGGAGPLAIATAKARSPSSVNLLPLTSSLARRGHLCRFRPTHLRPRSPSLFSDRMMCLTLGQDSMASMNWQMPSSPRPQARSHSSSKSTPMIRSSSHSTGPCTGTSRPTKLRFTLPVDALTNLRRILSVVASPDGSTTRLARRCFRCSARTAFKISRLLATLNSSGRWSIS